MDNNIINNSKIIKGFFISSSNKQPYNKIIINLFNIFFIKI